MATTDDPKSLLERVLREGLARVAPDAAGVEIQLERPRNPEHGDFSCNVAMQLARLLKRKPREVAQQVVESVQGDLAASGQFAPLEIAGTGFINVRLSPLARAAVAMRIDAQRAVVAVDEAASLLTEGKPRRPHQRGVAEHPQLAWRQQRQKLRELQCGGAENARAPGEVRNAIVGQGSSFMIRSAQL